MTLTNHTPTQTQLASEYADARSEQKRADLKSAAEREFRQQCPFTPKVSRVRHVKCVGGVADTINGENAKIIVHFLSKRTPPFPVE